MADALTQYKLILLYMLNHSNISLANTQISNFILEKGYTDYFTLQQMLNELITSSLVVTESTYNNTLYHITPKGKETLSFFSDKVSVEIKEDVDSYFEENKAKLKHEVSTPADYRRINSQEYEVHCRIRENEKERLSLMLFVSCKEQAQAICNNWQAGHEEVYHKLMDVLMR